MSRFEMLLRAGLALVLLGVWLLLTYCPPVGNAAALLTFVPMTLAALAGHSLQPSKTNPGSESGI